MPKKKRKIVSLEVLEPNSTWDYTATKVLNNFICDAEDAEKTIQDMDRRDYWKHETDYKNQIRGILSAPGTRYASNSFFGDDVHVEEVKLPQTIKATTKYVYKVYDYTGEKVSTEYGTQKDVIGLLNKKIKTKYVYVTYNGSEEKIEYSQKAVADILSELEETTSQFQIESIGRSGMTSDPVIISIFKNKLK